MKESPTLHILECLVVNAIFSRKTLDWASLTRNVMRDSLLDIQLQAKLIECVTLGFKNKTRCTLYVSPGSQISHIATNNGISKDKCLKYNELSIRNITSESKQREGHSDLQVKTPLHRDPLTG
jgi:hypothetical protein